MTLFQLREDLVLPFLGLLLAGGLFLTIKLGFFQFRRILLSLKILTGALDWKGAKGKIVPFQAFAAGSASTIIIGAVLGTAFAYSLAGPGILPFIWLSYIPAAAIQFCSACFAVRFRKKMPGGSLLCGVSVYTEAGLKAHWLALVHALLFMAVSLTMGASVPTVVLHAVTDAGGWNISALTLSIGLGVILAFLMTGGIRRIGWASAYLVPAGVTLACIGAALLIIDLRTRAANPSLGNFFGLVFQGTRDLADVNPALRYGGLFPTMAGVALFLAFTEIGSGKLAAIAGTVRTDFAAKQGLSAILAPLFQSLVVSTVTGYVIHLAAVAGVPDIVGFAFKTARGSSLFLLGATVLTVAGLAGWIFAGYQAALYTGGRRLGIAFEILFLAALFGAGYFVRTQADAGGTILAAAAAAVMFTALFPMVATIIMNRLASSELKKYMEDRYIRYEISKDIYLLVMLVLPKNLISRLFGAVSGIRLPRFIRVPVLLAFAKFYKIDLDEAEMKLAEYPSLNRFFTRALKAGVRVIDQGRSTIVSPVDARVSQFGAVNEGRMIQAKGIDYTVSDLLENSEYIPRFERGQYMVMYLSPQDYHRIHCPFTGDIIGYHYAPGALFAVNNILVDGLAGLFPKNERLTSFVQTPQGLIAVVKVGATNVGKIAVTYDDVKTNRWIRRAENHRYTTPIHMDKGAELGRFEMGSTVILLFENDTVKIDSAISEQCKVRLGQAVATFVKS